MPRFTYRVVDAEGTPSEGVLEAATARDCVAGLREQGFRVNAVTLTGVKRGLFARRESLTWEDLDLLNEQLLTITKGGLPLASSLAALAGDIKRPRLRRAIRELHARLDAGVSLSEALEDRPESFPAMYRRMIRAGERSGNLSGVLSHLCAYSARMVELKHRLQEIMVYPLFVCVAVCAVLGFILVKVVPVFMGFYRDFRADLPVPTQFLVDVSALARNDSARVMAWLGMAALAVVLAAAFARRTAAGARAFDWLALHMPIFGPRNYAGAVARFSRTLGMLLTNEVPATEGLELAAAAADNAILADRVHAAVRRVENGETIADALTSTGFFAGTYCWILDHAEQAGEIDAALLGLAHDCEQDLERRDRIIVSMAGPVTILILGLLVGFVVAALYLPIYNVGSSVVQ